MNMTALVSTSRTPLNPVYGYALLFGAIALLPALGVYPIFVMKVLCFALFACAFNLLVGFTGLLSFGQRLGRKVEDGQAALPRCQPDRHRLADVPQADEARPHRRRCTHARKTCPPSTSRI